MESVEKKKTKRKGPNISLRYRKFIIYNLYYINYF